MKLVALELDEFSRKLIKREFRRLSPINWEMKANRVVLHERKAIKSDLVGKKVEITATKFGYTDGILALKVEGVDSDLPYIIVSINKNIGAKESDIRNIKTWFDLKTEIVLQGRVVEYWNGIIKESNLYKTKDKPSIIRVAFYDFDKTLVETESSEMGRYIWEKKTKKKYPHIGWWSKKESLDQTIFDFEPIKEITEKLKRDFKDSSCWTVLLTNRISSLKPEVLSILDSLGLQLDEARMVEKPPMSKNQRILEVLNDLPQASLIEIYDDDMGNIEMFLELKEQLNEDGKSVSIYHVNPQNYEPRVTKVS